MLILFLTSCAGVHGETDIGSGFRDLKWGDDISTDADYRIVSESKNKVILRAVRQEETLQYAGTEVNEIIYSMKNRRFFMAEINGSGLSAFFQMKAHLFDEYGEPGIERPEMNVYMWVIDNVSILLRYFRMDDRFSVTMQNQRI